MIMMSRLVHDLDLSEGGLCSVASFSLPNESSGMTRVELGPGTVEDQEVFCALLGSSHSTMLAETAFLTFYWSHPLSTLASGFTCWDRQLPISPKV